jgi:hypothetical protein
MMQTSLGATATNIRYAHGSRTSERRTLSSALLQTRRSSAHAYAVEFADTGDYSVRGFTRTGCHYTTQLHCALQRPPGATSHSRGLRFGCACVHRTCSKSAARRVYAVNWRVRASLRGASLSAPLLYVTREEKTEELRFFRSTRELEVKDGGNTAATFAERMRRPCDRLSAGSAVLKLLCQRAVGLLDGQQRGGLGSH